MDDRIEYLVDRIQQLFVGQIPRSQGVRGRDPFRGDRVSVLFDEPRYSDEFLARL